MLQRPLPTIACGALLASPEVAQRLLSELTSDVAPLWRGLDVDPLRIDVIAAMGRAMDREWPRRFRLNEVERAGELICPKMIFANGELPLLDQAFDSVMCIQDSQVVRRPGREPAFAWLASEIDPTVFVAWHLARKLEVDSCFGSAVRRQIHDQNPVFERATEGVHVADNHVHLGGVSAHEFVLARHLMGNGGALPPEIRSVCLRLRELLAVFVQIGANEVLQGAEHDEVLRRACSAEHGDSPTIGLDWAGLVDTYGDDTIDPANWLRGRLAQAAARGDLARAWLLLTVLILFIYGLPNTRSTTRVAVIYFLVEVMVLRRSLVVDGQGLRRFASRYYSPALREQALDNRRDHSRNSINRLLIGTGDLAELKVTPSAFKPELALRLAEATAQNVKSTANWDFYKLIWDCEAWTPEVANYVGELERWHFCAHFIRGEIPLRGGRRARRKALWKEANALSNAVFSHTGWNFAHFLGGSANEYLDFHAGRWLRALDVAGDETAWPIEYYAPQLRWVRARLEANPLFGATDSRMHDIGNRQSPLHCHKVHLSVHAGEDYDHPASGLRHVDETIRFCAMRSGDRLGHALALGIDPGKWMNDHGDALLTVDEHLDNLVWLWHYAGELAEESVHAAQAQQELAQRISRFIPEVNWANGKGPTPQNLFDAWKLRINCPVRLDEAAGGLALSPDLAMVVPDFELLLVSQGQDVSRELYLARVMQEAALDVSTEVESRLVLVRTYKSDLVIDGEPQYMDDVESRNTLLFMRDLQDHLLNKCMENGLCIETNPTSNLYISRLLSYTEHPIFRWSPPESEDLLPFIGKWNQSGLRNGPVSVLINTDDPGIMPTTLRMELALIEAAALELGYEPALVTKWINDIRMRGMDVFGSNHVPVFTQLKP